MSLALDKPHTFESKFKNIKLLATEFDEPYYGRTLWRFRLLIDNEIYNHKLLDYENTFCGLSSNLEKFILESQDGKYIYIPYNLLVLNTENLELTKYERESGSDNEFISNIFINTDLIVLNERAVYIIDMSSKKITQKFYPFEKLVFQKMWKQGEVMKFLYKDQKTGSSHTLDYSLENKKFTNDVV